MFEKLRNFRRDRDGTSAVEFALVAPFLMVLMLGGFDTARYAIAVRNLSQTANSITQMISVNTSKSISSDDLRFYQDSAMVTFPQVLQDSSQQGVDWTTDLGMTVTSVQFTNKGTSTNPIYTAAVAWSVGTTPRPCNTAIASASDDAAPSRTTLPANTFGPGTLIVVDLVFTFRPTIASKILAPIKIVRSYYMQPRYVDSVNHTVSGSENGKTCAVS